MGLTRWTNADHPTESTPGDPGTLPPGASANDADLDFTGTMMPPPGSGAPALSEDEKITFARWVDLGCPISSKDPILQTMGWFTDALKPTLTLASPRAGSNSLSLSAIQIGMFDSYSGLNPGSLSVTANFPVNGQSPGAELAPLFVETGDQIWSLQLSSPITDLAEGELFVKVADQQGNITSIERSFTILGSGGCDITGDGQIDVLDLQQLINAVLTGSLSLAYDINGDGSVNVGDLQSLANVILGLTGCP